MGKKNKDTKDIEETQNTSDNKSNVNHKPNKSSKSEVINKSDDENEIVDKYSLYLKTTHIKELKILFEILKELLDDINIVIKKKKNKDTKSKEKFDSDSGIKILQFNNDGTLIVKVFLDYKDFSKFYVDTTKITIGITISELYKYLKSINDNDILILSMEKNNKQNLILEAYNEKNCSKNECLLKLLELDNPKQLFNECELEFVITMSTAEFNKICKEFAAISEYIEIICSASKIIFQTKGDSLIRKLSFQNCSEKKTQDGVHIDTKIVDKNYTVELIFLLEYLTRFNKCTQLSDKVMLYLRQNSPIFIQYQIASIGNLIIANSPTKQDNHI